MTAARQTQCLLGIDIGTTGAKALLIDSSGAVLATRTSEYAFSTPKPLWAEQDPNAWWRGTIDAIGQVLEQSQIEPAQIAAIGLTGQMHGLVALGGHGEPLRPCIMWNDQRSSAQCAAIQKRLGAERILQITGKPVLPNFTAPKILWVREHEPDIYARIAHIVLPKDYVRYRMTGTYVSDVADASGTSLFDVGRRRWSDEMVEQLEVPRAWLPNVLESPEVAGALSKQAALETGLLEGTPVVAGAGDQAAEAVGLGVVNEHDVSVTIGTSGVVFVSFDRCRVDPNGLLHAYCHAAPGAWHMMGVMLAAGGSLRWYRDALGEPERSHAIANGRDPYDVLIEEAAQVSPGCEGLIFLPYLSGERTPHADPHARGTFVGLSLRHRKAHLTRAVMEGVTFGLMDSLQLVRGMGLPCARILVSGGGAKSAFWRQLMADVFNAEIVTVNATQGAAFGAAVLAGVGAGMFASVEEACASIIHQTSMTSPSADASTYPRYYERFRNLYPTLRAHFATLNS